MSYAYKAESISSSLFIATHCTSCQKPPFKILESLMLDCLWVAGKNKQQFQVNTLILKDAS